MKTRLLLLMLLMPLVGCNALKKITEGPTSTPGPSPLPADITITGVTTTDFDFIPVRVVNSHVTVKVNRANSPEQDWHECDQFEIFLSTKGTGGSGVRFRYLNLPAGGVSFPVAPKGTSYEIHSVLNN